MAAILEQTNTTTPEYCSTELLESLEQLQAENQTLRDELARVEKDNADLRYEVRSWRGA